MNREQFLLGKIAEEAGEVTQIAIKAQQHGLSRAFTKEDTNIERIVSELNDLLAVVIMLDGSIAAKITINNEAQMKKREKVEYWFKDAIKEGYTTDE